MTGLDSALPSTAPDAQTRAQAATTHRHGTQTLAATVQEVFDHIVGDEFANVTFTGGDPFFRPLGFAKLAEKLKAETNKNIWCYTGYLFENLLKNENAMKLLRHLDVLVDGPFRQELRDEDLLYRGSSNQRLVDVQKSLAAGKFVEYDYNPYKLK